QPSPSFPITPRYAGGEASRISSISSPLSRPNYAQPVEHRLCARLRETALTPPSRISLRPALAAQPADRPPDDHRRHHAYLAPGVARVGPARGQLDGRHARPAAEVQDEQGSPGRRGRKMCDQPRAALAPHVLRREPRVEFRAQLE